MLALLCLLHFSCFSVSQHIASCWTRINWNNHHSGDKSSKSYQEFSTEHNNAFTDGCWMFAENGCMSCLTWFFCNACALGQVLSFMAEPRNFMALICAAQSSNASWLENLPMALLAASKKHDLQKITCSATQMAIILNVLVCNNYFLPTRRGALS